MPTYNPQYIAFSTPLQPPKKRSHPRLPRSGRSRGWIALLVVVTVHDGLIGLNNALVLLSGMRQRVRVGPAAAVDAESGDPPHPAPAGPLDGAVADDRGACLLVVKLAVGHSGIAPQERPLDRFERQRLLTRKKLKLEDSLAEPILRKRLWPDSWSVRPIRFSPGG
jgi:hypothetical protein